MIRAWSAPSVGAKFEQISYDPGPMKGDDVEIAVTACGLCHSDMSLWEDEWGITQFPLTPGHEVVGVITQVGDTVTHLKVGDTVGVGWFSRSCLNCDPCMHGDHNMCVAVEQIAVGRHGGFADKGPGPGQLGDQAARRLEGGGRRPAVLRRHHRVQPDRSVWREAHRQGRCDRHWRAGPSRRAIPQRLGL
jgi:hypothetical protein